MTELRDEISSYTDQHDELCESIEEVLDEKLPVKATVVSVENNPTSSDDVAVDIEFEELGEEVAEAFDEFEMGHLPRFRISAE